MAFQAFFSKENIISWGETFVLLVIYFLINSYLLLLMFIYNIDLESNFEWKYDHHLP